MNAALRVFKIEPCRRNHIHTLCHSKQLGEFLVCIQIRDLMPNHIHDAVMQDMCIRLLLETAGQRDLCRFSHGFLFHITCDAVFGKGFIPVLFLIQDLYLLTGHQILQDRAFDPSLFPQCRVLRYFRFLHSAVIRGQYDPGRFLIVCKIKRRELLHKFQ